MVKLAEKLVESGSGGGSAGGWVVVNSGWCL